ncbi:MAG: biotin--[acetyl-CoA-carboxylase] ligase [Anaeroplasmataceae bacterium]
MKVIYFDSLPSTNTYLKENYNKYNDEDVVLAITQTQGRGRFTREWISNNDLTFSILFKNNNYNHGLIAPLSIIDALETNGINAKIKWPNDIYLNNKKLSGILIESIIENNNTKCIIVGIGLNLSKKSDDLNANYIDINRDKILNDILDSYKKLMLVNEDVLLRLYYGYSLLNNHYIIYNDKKYRIKGYTKNLLLEVYNDEEELLINASEIDIKSSIIKI